MGWYILKLVVLLPLIGGMIWGSLKLSRMMQQKLGAPQGGRAVRIVETMMLSPTIRLAVLEFHGRQILVSASRHGMARLAEAPARPDEDDGGNGSRRRPAPSPEQEEDAFSGPFPVSPPGALRDTPETFTQTLRRFK